MNDRPNPNDLGTFIYLLLFVTMALIAYHDFKDNQIPCKAAKMEAKVVIAGVVKKNIFKRIIMHTALSRLINLKEKTMYCLIGGGDEEDFYHFVEVGDTIHKTMNSLTYRISRRNAIKKEFFLRFACPDTIPLPR